MFQFFLFIFYHQFLPFFPLSKCLFTPQPQIFTSIFFYLKTKLYEIFQVALKRQQAAEDAIALGLAAVATGKQYGFLPQGPIFGFEVTDPKLTPEKPEEPKPAQIDDDETPIDVQTTEDDEPKTRKEVMEYSLEMLAKLFPNKKRSVLELVLKRCGDDLIKAIEEIVPKTAGKINELNPEAGQKEQFEKLKATIDAADEKSAFRPVGPRGRLPPMPEVFLPFSPSISTALFALSAPSFNIGCSLGNFPLPPTFNHFNMVSHLPNCPSDLLLHVPGPSRGDVHVLSNVSSLHRVKDVLYPTDLSSHAHDNK